MIANFATSQNRETEKANWSGRGLFIVRIYAPWRQKVLEIFGFLRKFEKQWRLSSCQQPRNRRQVSSHDRARECVARTPANRQNFLICCCGWLPTARHSCILQQFCAFSFAQAVPPYSFHLPRTDAPYHVHSKPPSSSLQFKNAHWVRCVRKEDENPSPNFLKYVVHSDL